MSGDASHLPTGYTLGAMRAGETAVLWEWARAEGWNPGQADLDVAWAFDPAAFVALRHDDGTPDGELIGGGTIISYHGAFGFMGLFIMRSDHRGRGLGAALWHHRRDRLIDRLQPGSTVGMDGVFAMVPFYERGGFRLTHRDLRFTGIAAGTPDPGVMPLSTFGIDAIRGYDDRHVAAPRTGFIEPWITAPGVRALATADGSRITGYGVARPCAEGYKIGPLFADTPAIADRIAGSLMSTIDGAQVQIDVPEPNEAGTALAQRYGLEESFGCARMYLGPPPTLPLDRTFGLTSLEFG